MMGVAARIVDSADILLVVGTSLNVYPAASLVDFVSPGLPIYVVDPGQPLIPENGNIRHIKEKAGAAMPQLVKMLLEEG
jgi:NAD-dependent deacetylase